MRKFFILSIAMLMALCANSQTLNTKMGEPTMEEMTMTECDYDSEATAVVLMEDLALRMESFNNTLQLTMDYKKRIKVLKEDGMNAATVTMTIKDATSNAGTKSRISDIKAFSFNLVDGKIVKTKMESNMVSKQRINDNLVKVEFAIPQAQVGSVIEYQYKFITDAIYDIPTWQAQSRYPVNYSHYELALPEYFITNVNMSGAHNIESKTETRHNHMMGCSDNVYNFTAKQLPALPKDNEHIFCPTDFADKVTCELSGVNIPGQMYKSYALSQVDVNEQLLKSDAFGGLLKQKNPLRDEMKAAGISELPTTMERAEATVRLMRKHLRWDGTYSLAGTSLSRVMKEGTGDNADLNFVLLSMFRDANVEAYPVVMSRRSRGRMPYSHPSIEALNTFIIAIYDDAEKIHYYDSSAENGYFDALPADLNVDRAIMIRNEASNYEEVSLQKNIKNRLVVAIEGELSADGLITGTCTSSRLNGFALSIRNKWENLNDSVAFVEKMATDDNIEITEYTTKGMDEFSPKVEERFTFSRQLEGDGKFYLNPLLLSFYNESAFKAETSYMPVEFGALQTTNITFTLRLPEGYHLEEAIKPLIMKLPENALEVRMVGGEQGGIFTANCRFSTNQLFFAPDSYSMVKEFFDSFANKCNEMIVISNTPAQ